MSNEIYNYKKTENEKDASYIPIKNIFNTKLISKKLKEKYHL